MHATSTILPQDFHLLGCCSLENTRRAPLRPRDRQYRNYVEHAAETAKVKRPDYGCSRRTIYLGYGKRERIAFSGETWTESIENVIPPHVIGSGFVVVIPLDRRTFRILLMGRGGDVQSGLRGYRCTTLEERAYKSFSV